MSTTEISEAASIEPVPEELQPVVFDLAEISPDDLMMLRRLKSFMLGSNRDQSRLSRVGLRWLDTMMRKNEDYGSAVWKTPVLCPGLPPGESIMVRMSDKISRIESIRSGKEVLVEDEPLDVTIEDLGVYCVLYLARPKS